MQEYPNVLHEHTIFTGLGFEVVQEEIQLATGHRRRRLTVRHPGAVVFLPCDADGVLLAIRQYRYALRQTLLEFPAGTIEPGELPLVCAQRELAEEVGRAARRWESLGELHPAPGFCNEVQYCFFATDLTPCLARHDDDEIIEVVPMRAAQVEQAICDGRMTDGKSIALYTRAKLRGFI